MRVMRVCAWARPARPHGRRGLGGGRVERGLLRPAAPAAAPSWPRSRRAASWTTTRASARPSPALAARLGGEGGTDAVAAAAWAPAASSPSSPSAGTLVLLSASGALGAAGALSSLVDVATAASAASVVMTDGPAPRVPALLMSGRAAVAPLAAWREHGALACPAAADALAARSQVPDLVSCRRAARAEAFCGRAACRGRQ